MIYIDFDSTLNDFLYKFIMYGNKYSDQVYTPEDIIKWNDLKNLYPRHFYDMFLENMYFDVVKPLPGAQLLIEQLQYINTVTILTDTAPDHINKKHELIKKYFEDIPVIFSQGDKLSYLRKNDILIDDNPNYIHYLPFGIGGILFTNNDNYIYTLNEKQCIKDSNYQHLFVAQNYSEIVTLVAKFFHHNDSKEYNGETDSQRRDEESSSTLWSIE